MRVDRGFALTTRGVVLLLGVSAVIAVVAQLALGASVLVLSLAVIIAVAGLLAFVLVGANNLGAWWALFYVSGNVLVALYAKTIMGQSLDSHLYVPVASFSVLAISTATLLTAILLVRRVNLGRPLFVRTADVRTLAWLSWGSFALGVTFWFLNQHFQDPGGSGFGGFAVFRDLLLMAVIARTALLLEGSDDRRTFDVQLGLILGTGVILGLLTNSKTYAAFPVVSYFVTLVFFRGGLARRHMVVFAAATVVFIGVVTPLIQAWRHLGQQRLPVAGRVAQISRGLSGLVAGGQFQRYADLAELDFRGGYYNYFGGDGRGQVLLGRYASVQQIDPVIAQTSAQGIMGGAAIWPALTRLLPSVLYPNKPQVTEAYTILVHFGLVNPAGGKYPTLPLAGQAYAAYGIPGLIVVCFVAFLVVLMALKKFGWTLHRNVFAIFIFAEFVVVYAAQGDLNQYAGLVLRGMPVFIAVFWLLRLAPRVRLRRRAPRGIPVMVLGRAKAGRP